MDGRVATFMSRELIRDLLTRAITSLLGTSLAIMRVCTHTHVFTCARTHTTSAAQGILLCMSVSYRNVLHTIRYDAHVSTLVFLGAPVVCFSLFRRAISIYCSSNYFILYQRGGCLIQIEFR